MEDWQEHAKRDNQWLGALGGGTVDLVKAWDELY